MTNDYDDESLSGLADTIQWRKASGFYGEFRAPGAGDVHIRYIQTVIDLGGSGTSSSQLASDIRPVREVFKVSDMSFEELLQRDIDDFRVATGIIPYLSDPKHASRVRFLPPILVAVMPYGDNKILARMPEKSIADERTQSWEPVAKLERVHIQGRPSAIAHLHYNPESSRLVVLDGQHRAMAVLAIKREKQNAWKDGVEYQRFYEEVGRGIKEISDEALKSIQLPVCLMLIDSADASLNLIDTCRRLFLDVNQTAKPPTTARMRLLDDVDFRSVFARRTLSMMRAPHSRPSDYGTAVHFFEYDNPKDTPRPTREIAYSSIEILWSMIRWSMFESDDYHTDLARKAGPSRPGKNLDRAVELIGLDDEFAAAELESLGLSSVSEVLASSKTLDRPVIDRVANRFETTMGQRIVRLFREALPFDSHSRAVADLAGQKAAAREGVGAIAFGALFDGAGTYWTLRDFHATRSQQRRDGASLAKLDVESAYETIKDQWMPEVERQRAAYLLGRNCSDISSTDVALVNQAFEVFRTQAFQVGLLMALCHLAHKTRSWSDATTWIELWNNGLMRKTAGRQRALFSYCGSYQEPVDGENGQPLGFMAVTSSKLQASDWVWFRYIAFEQMLSACEGKGTDHDALLEGAQIGRSELLRLLRSEVEAEARRNGRTASEADTKSAVIERAHRAVGKTFGISKETLSGLWSNPPSKSSEQGEPDSDPGAQ